MNTLKFIHIVISVTKQSQLIVDVFRDHIF